MATFELGSVRAARAGARQFVLSRFAPLYLAGLLAGIGGGAGLAMLEDGPQQADARHAVPVADPAAELLLPRDVRAPAPVIRDTGPEPFVPPGLPPLSAEIARYWEGVTAALQEESGRQAQAGAPAPAAGAPAAPRAAPSAPAAPSEASDAGAPAAPEKPNFYVPDVPQGPATDLEWRLFAAANAEREKAGLAPLAYDHGLSIIARTRVRQLVDQGYFAHVDPYGYRMYVELLAYFGYTSYAWAGENLAMNNYSVAESPERAMVALMNSPSHRANILSSDFTRVGIGELTTPDGRHFYAMIFLG